MFEEKGERQRVHVCVFLFVQAKKIIIKENIQSSHSRNQGL